MDTTTQTELPSSLVLVICAIIVGGVCVNIWLILTLLRKQTNGVLSTIIQLALVDVLASPIAIIELWTLNNRAWTFPFQLCRWFFGARVFLDNLSLYLTVALNFHTLFSWSTHLYEVETNRNPLTCCANDDDDDGSEEFLVRSRSVNSIPNRNLVIDYRNMKSSTSTLYPSLIIWFTCASLSITDVLFASVRSVEHAHVCTNARMPDGYLKNLPLLFNSVVPLVLFNFSFILLIVKYCQNPRHVSDLAKTVRMRFLLVLTIAIAVLYLITSAQHHLIYFINFLSNHNGNVGTALLRDSFIFANIVTLVSSIIRRASIIVRSIFYCLIARTLSKVLSVRSK